MTFAGTAVIAPFAAGRRSYKDREQPTARVGASPRREQIAALLRLQRHLNHSPQLRTSSP